MTTEGYLGLGATVILLILIGGARSLLSFFNEGQAAKDGAVEKKERGLHFRL